MSRTVRILVFVLVTSALPTTTLFTTSVFAAPPKALPSMTFGGIDGHPLRTEDLEGKVVLLDFWASWCIPCRKSFPEVDRLSRDFVSKGLTVVAVSVDEQRKNADAFLTLFPHSMTVAFDPAGAAAATLDLQGMPSSLLIDRSGHIRFTHMGYRKKTVEQFRAEIVQLLAEAK